ncbi:hypothetical protein [Rathayibacter festucae]|uniref:hypothetical protein n=1 Tax=Rathayibacter festucae TaxID=110937 RepID=UPI000FDC1D17|nr:hypothetical protein [Rathayibacter festucae]
MDARGFWDGIAQWFGYDSWDWGSAADWFAAVGTVGAFVLALILWRVEARRRSRTLADKFVVSARFMGPIGYYDESENVLRLTEHGQNLKIEYRNIGEVPIYFLRLSLRTDYSKVIAPEHNGLVEDEFWNRETLDPGESRRQLIHLEYPDNSMYLLIFFNDVDGVFWRKRALLKLPYKRKYLSAFGVRLLLRRTSRDGEIARWYAFLTSTGRILRILPLIPFAVVYDFLEARGWSPNSLRRKLKNKPEHRKKVPFFRSLWHK